eukprot:TRINITY_DN11502_c1_g1_i1.p1 TRINITY_DN11502_c1_g1~~TRINITY_DN11502_c1_g1_i1.p1  ORF type:complete len:516 (+),score=112.77 TRINITY_DN11502_c1_g1_i1:37-1584(+)
MLNRVSTRTKRFLRNRNRFISTIPYHPGLALGNVVNEKILKTLEEIGKVQAPIDVAQNSFNALLQTKRSNDMTIRELREMNIDTSDMDKTVEDLQVKIRDSAKKLAEQRINSRQEIDSKTLELGSIINDYPESPLDYNKTQMKYMPLSADSIQLDAQYFSFDSNSQDASSHISSVKGFVASSLKVLGTERSGEASHSSQSQISRQMENKSYQGTLVITCACTHQNAGLLAPLIIDVDKAIRVWNYDQKNKGGKDFLKVDDPSVLAKLAEEEGTDKETSYNIVSGITYGSSFVGMVHVLKVEETTTSQSMTSIAQSIQGQMKAGNWFAKWSGGFGVDSTFANDVKKMLSSQEISSHISFSSMGVIPSIKSNEVQIGVKTLADFDPAKMMDKLSTYAAATNSENRSMDESAAAARTGGNMVNFRKAEIQGVLTGLGEIDDGANRMLDINSLMTSFEDFVNKVAEGNKGVPVNYYIKPITKAQLAKMWVDKYYPGQFTKQGTGDDSAGTASSGSDTSS